MAAKDRSIYEIFTIRSNDGSKTIDMRGGIVSFSYFENVFSPMITAQVLITTTGNVITDEDGDLTSIYNGRCDIFLNNLLLHLLHSFHASSLTKEFDNRHVEH